MFAPLGVDLVAKAQELSSRQRYTLSIQEKILHGQV